MQLIITEKPSVARALSTALDIRDKEKHQGYIEGDDRIVSWCYGHLVELAEPAEYGEQYKKWTYEGLPILPEKWKHEVKPETKEQFDILKSLMERDDVTEVVEATDAGREGELIFRLVYEKAGCRKPVRRVISVFCFRISSSVCSAKRILSATAICLHRSRPLRRSLRWMSACSAAKRICRALRNWNWN